MKVAQVDPYNVNADEMNERKENLNLSELEQSVSEQGIIQPPIVRERDGDHEVDYTVVVGQRRTLAAQGAGLDTIPVVVMDWNDREALDASVTENIDAFREDVSPKDRALAVERRLQEDDVNSITDLAEVWGVHRKLIEEWMERTRNEWEGTVVDPEVEENEQMEASIQQQIEEMDDEAISTIRRTVGGGEKGEELVKKAAKHDLSKNDIRELSKKVNSGRDVEDALAQTIEEKHDTGDIKVSANVTFSGEYAGALTNYAQDRGMTENEVVREAIQNYLDREGYL